MRAILKSKRYYEMKELIAQFKTHIWGVMECHSGGLFHASDTALQKLDQVHYHFLRELGVDARQAFTEFNFASPIFRRNIVLLILRHGCSLRVQHV